MKNLKRNVDGITLIALVVTIVVLLILASVSITAVFGDNGLIQIAKKAAEETEKASEEEQRQLTIAEATMNLNGTKYKSTYEGEEVTVPIPAGFAVSQVKGESTVDDGLVIIDSEGNEFVWIPVAKETFETNFKRVEGYLNGQLQNRLSQTDEANEHGVNEMLSEDISIQEEAKEMYASVYKNGGFYLGRYEAGKDDNDNVVIKKNAKVYNKITWSSSTFDKNPTGGAVEKARSMYTSSSSVVSHLCYGVEWDAALNFIDSNYITSSCSSDSYVANANGKGWDKTNYSEGNPEHLTGIDVDTQKSNCQKNIYDMAGNVSELTMEVMNVNAEIHRVRRGTGFDYDCNSSDRSASDYNGGFREYIGFRVALYLN